MYCPDMDMVGSGEQEVVRYFESRGLIVRTAAIQ
jgi:hypothetical protein